MDHKWPVLQAWAVFNEDFEDGFLDRKNLTEAILKDSVDTVLAILANYPADLDQISLINRSSQNPHGLLRSHLEGCPSVRLPHMVAALCGSVKCVKLFLSMGINVDATEHENSVIHVLVWGSIMWPTKIGNYINIYRYLEATVEKYIFKKMLMHENDCGLRPLELAAMLGTLAMLDTIFNTEGIYRFRQPSPVLQNYDYYDVTDYHVSTGTRHMQSPFFQLMMLRDSQVKEKETTEFLTSPLIKTWTRASICCLRGFNIVTILITFSYCILVYIVIQSIQASKAQKTPLDDFLRSHGFGCSIVVLLESLVIFVEKIILFVRFFRLRKEPSFRLLKFVDMQRGRKRIVDIKALHLTAAAQCLIIIVLLPMVMTAPAEETKFPILYFCIYFFSALLSWLNVWHFLYFLQLLPIVGYFIVVFQRMLHDILRFLVLLSLFLATFALIFYSLLRYPCDNTLDLSFITFHDSFYTTFKIMLNMEDITQFAEKESPLAYVLTIVHMLFFLTCTILVINFMIAVMSNTVSVMFEYEAVYRTLDIVAKLNNAEGYITRCLPCIRPALTRGFVQEDGKVYLLVCDKLNIDD